MPFPLAALATVTDPISDSDPFGLTWSSSTIPFPPSGCRGTDYQPMPR
jgi:hypothetical protein